ncbi:phage integrase family protein [Actinokineospora spheciospongiae]|uniref:Phage integrase family protein n=1 Tax=Actinokineospora spheciospongiae TaxID=909613 RepID=W7IZI8_9PSEU|nr:tyrosine-type recombinase/integrase [Actinokineospora spheciospongiae]EWC61976.1 phage integrase family protein [Actinokineospora spheciospongiae]
MELSEAQEAFFVARRSRKDSPHTTAAYRRDLAGVTAHLAQALGTARIELADVTAQVLREAFGAFADTHAKSSVARAWSTWNQFFQFCLLDGLSAGNPMGAIGRPKPGPLSPKPLRGERTPEELLTAIAGGARRARAPWPERDLLVLALGLVAGLRASEMRALRRSSVVGRPGERRLYVHGKANRERSIPIEVPLERVIEAYLVSCEVRFPGLRFSDEGPLVLGSDGEGIGRGGLDYLVKQCFRQAGLHDRVPAGANLHALRHTFATRLAEDGANAVEIMVLLGHASLNTSQGYIDATGRERRAAAASNRTYRALEGLGGDGQ